MKAKVLWFSLIWSELRDMGVLLYGKHTKDTIT